MDCHKTQAPVLPGQATAGQQGTAFSLGILYQLLVAHRVYDARHHPMPVLHQAMIGEIITPQFGQCI